MTSYSKIKNPVPAPRAKPAGAGKFPHVTAPKLAPLKTRIYTKASLNEDPMKFTESGFGDTGLEETPSIIGMGRNAK